MIHAFASLRASLQRLGPLALIPLLVTLSSATLAQQPADMPPTPVIGAEVSRKAWSDPLESLGTLAANESVTLSATVTDTVSAINFEGGERVKRGEVLVELSDAEEQAALREAQALRVERQNAVDRLSQLQSRNLAPRADVEDSRAQLQQVDATLQGLRARLENYRVKAPFDGVVGVRDISVGTLVTPGTELVTLDDVSRMKLDFEIPEVQLGSLTEGLAVTATTAAYPDRVFEGDVGTIDSRVDPVSRSIAVRALIDNPDQRLRPGMLMRVTIARRPRQALVIPESAVVPEGQRQRVWVITSREDGSVERRDISVGERRRGEVEVTEGLTAGELVVSHGADRLHAASRVRLIGIEDDSTSVSEILRANRQGDDA
ncbi:efflux RND transporter periplasmic adaptor subunit [Halomonas organivorans]|uniref:Membrane fusion protein (Multidrug efflux system) n=1 Tax=Halomonas organivorans TaxID=257772 RepID=A0A7W5BW56_9GAMM|nr:efflux RND transporter periplasmic adaptor subunit [Halomonas organivorans]MBB3140204.1 membrane fusion protein (multidrug efflux system) [Halomonas organivorans]